MSSNSDPFAAMILEGATATRHLQPGECLFLRGDRIRDLHLVVDGTVQLTRTDLQGTDLILYRAQPGDIVAEPSLFADTYHCDAFVENAATLATMPKTAVLAALQDMPPAGRAMIKRLAGQVHRLRGLAALHRIRPADERVFTALAWEAGGETELSLDRPWTVFAAEIGLTHEAVYRSLAALQRAKRIDRQDRHVMLRRE